MVTTDYNDTVYVGYYQSGKETTSYSNVANSQDNGPDGTKTDGNQSITTVDLGAGDDLMVIRGNMLANTRVYTGEGNDTFTMDGMNTALRVMYAGSYIFTESGDDIVTIKRTGVTNAGQIYLGSGSDTFIQGMLLTITIQHYLVYWILVVVQKIYLIYLRNIFLFIRMAVI